MDTTTKIAKITALIAELANKSPHYDYEFEINATLDSCVDSLNLLLECEKSCPATASSTLTDEEIETHNKQWELKDLIPNVEEEEEEEDSVVYCFECKNPTTMCDCTDYCTQHCNEEQKHFKHTFYTLAKTDYWRKKGFIRYVKCVLGIKKSIKDYNVIWESDIETYDTLYFDTENPDNRHIQVDYRILGLVGGEYCFKFDVQYQKYNDNNNVWTYL